jgi:hypothetical protein
MACLWHFVSAQQSDKSTDINTWLIEKDLIDKDWHIKYLNSFHWSVTTMLTVGYGDITPKNKYEMLFNILAMLLGCVIFGYSLNEIGEILRFRGKQKGKLK